MSTTGNPDLPRATPEAMAQLSTPAPDPKTDLEGFLANAVKGAKIMAGSYPVDEAQTRALALSNLERSYYPVGFLRQYAAILASPDRRPKLKTITAPTLVIHGDADPLVPVEGGRDTAATIPGAELLILPGMGHSLPPVIEGEVVAGIVSAAHRAKRSA
jgi:pimeloyl-ACP methyl ester carboxylesterase